MFNGSVALMYDWLIIKECNTGTHFSHIYQTIFNFGGLALYKFLILNHRKIVTFQNLLFLSRGSLVFCVRYSKRLPSFLAG